MNKNNSEKLNGHDSNRKLMPLYRNADKAYVRRQLLTVKFVPRLRTSKIQANENLTKEKRQIHLCVSKRMYYGANNAFRNIFLGHAL